MNEIELCGQTLDLDNLQSGYFCMDCMDGMAKFPDKYFDLAVVDPPYGISINNNMGRRHGDKKSSYPRAFWDSKPPDAGYFNELFRVSKAQIIWGGELLQFTTDEMLSGLAQAEHIRGHELFDA